jgi:hypothetical protein
MANSKQATAGIGLGRSTKTKHGDEAGASAPAPKRRAVLGSISEGTLLVRDTHYQIKGLCSFLHDIQCYICQDWDGESMWHLKCRNAECSHLGYVCHTCTRNPGFEMKCSVCRGETRPYCDLFDAQDRPHRMRTTRVSRAGDEGDYA